MPIENVSLAVPAFERVRLRLLLIAPAPVPKLSEVGNAVMVLLRAAARFKTPFPACCTVAAAAGLIVAGPVLLIRSERDCGTVSPGRAAFKTAAAPATKGLEKRGPPGSMKPDGSYDPPSY